MYPLLSQQFMWKDLLTDRHAHTNIHIHDTELSHMKEAFHSHTARQSWGMQMVKKKKKENTVSFSPFLCFSRTYTHTHKDIIYETHTHQNTHPTSVQTADIRWLDLVYTESSLARTSGKYATEMSPHTLTSKPLQNNDAHTHIWMHAAQYRPFATVTERSMRQQPIVNTG